MQTTLNHRRFVNWQWTFREVALLVLGFQVEQKYRILWRKGKPEDPENNPWSKDGNQRQTLHLTPAAHFSKGPVT